MSLHYLVKYPSCFWLTTVSRLVVFASPCILYHTTPHHTTIDTTTTTTIVLQCRRSNKNLFNRRHWRMFNCASWTADWNLWNDWENCHSSLPRRCYGLYRHMTTRGFWGNETGFFSGQTWPNQQHRKIKQNVTIGTNIMTIHLLGVWHKEQELIRRWDSERELLRSAPGSYLNLLK